MLLVLCAAIFLIVLPIGPSPSDDLFYIDAAHRLQARTYQAPSEQFPYHHYLRWPVTLPLALLFALFGLSGKTIAAFTAFHLFGVCALTYSIALRLYGRRILAMLAALAPFMIPESLLPWLVRAEPPCLLWALVALQLTLSGGGLLRTFAAGLCMAVAANAQQVALFAVPGIALLTLRQTSSANRRAARTVSLLAGVTAGVLGIMCLEWLLLGDFWIELKSMKWWHLRPIYRTSASDGLAGFLDPSDERRFVLGFLKNLSHAFPLMSAAFCGGVVLRILAWRRVLTPSRDMILAAGLTIGLLEMLGPLAVEKTYIRFLVIPLYLICIEFIALVYETAIAKPARWWSRLPTLALAVAAIPHLKDNLERLTRVPEHMRYYADPVRLIAADIRQRRVLPRKVLLLFQDKGLPGLIDWSWAVQCYSDYRLADAKIRERIRVPPRDHARVTYFVGTEPGPFESAGFKVITYPHGQQEASRPQVLVHETSQDPVPSK